MPRRRRWLWNAAVPAPRIPTPINVREASKHSVALCRLGAHSAQPQHRASRIHRSVHRCLRAQQHERCGRPWLRRPIGDGCHGGYCSGPPSGSHRHVPDRGVVSMLQSRTPALLPPYTCVGLIHQNPAGCIGGCRSHNPYMYVVSLCTVLLSTEILSHSQAGFAYVACVRLKAAHQKPYQTNTKGYDLELLSKVVIQCFRWRRVWQHC